MLLRTMQRPWRVSAGSPQVLIPHNLFTMELDIWMRMVLIVFTNDKGICFGVIAWWL